MKRPLQSFIIVLFDDCLVSEGVCFIMQKDVLTCMKMLQVGGNSGPIIEIDE